VPTQLARLANAVGNVDYIADEYLLAMLRRFDAILVGGQAPRSADVNFLRTLGVNIVTTYGMAETCGGCVYDGQPLSGVELQLGEDSRIQLRGPVLANNLQHTGALTSESWLQTNDVGQIDDHGKLTVLGRSDRVLISGGIKVALDAVEELTASIGGVVEACAVALDGGEWGERVGVAYVGSPEVADYLAGAIFDQLGIAAKPIRVLRIDRLPRLAASQKPDLQRIKELFERQ
jgi:O-succinylbenzoic acid--CoA ligase